MKIYMWHIKKKKKKNTHKTDPACSQRSGTGHTGTEAALTSSVKPQKDIPTNKVQTAPTHPPTPSRKCDYT